MYPTDKSGGFQQPSTSPAGGDHEAPMTAGILRPPEGECPIRRESGPRIRRPAGSLGLSRPTLGHAKRSRASAEASSTRNGIPARGLRPVPLWNDIRMVPRIGHPMRRYRGLAAPPIPFRPTPKAGVSWEIFDES